MDNCHRSYQWGNQLSRSSNTLWVLSLQYLKIASLLTKWLKVLLMESCLRTSFTIRYLALEMIKIFVRRKCCYFWIMQQFIRRNFYMKLYRRWKLWFFLTHHIHHGWIQLNSTLNLWNKKWNNAHSRLSKYLLMEIMDFRD